MRIEQARAHSTSTTRGYQAVAARILRLARDQHLTPGDRLPGEIDLARACGVSRPTVREAMIALEIAGEIEIRSGSGAYIRNASTRLSLLLDSGPGPFDLLRARLLIEGEIAANAAAQATSVDLARIEATLTAMRKSIARQQNTQLADRHFHVAIAEAAGNHVLATIVDGLWAGIFAPMFHTLSRRTGLHHHQSMTLSDHEAIYAAIANHNAPAARSAMRKHLRHVEDILSAPESPDAPDARQATATPDAPPPNKPAKLRTIKQSPASPPVPPRSQKRKPV